MALTRELARISGYFNHPRSRAMLLQDISNVNTLPLPKNGMSAGSATVRRHPESGCRDIPLGQREILTYDRRVKITMTVTLAPELTEAIKESAERHGLSLDDWIAAAAKLKFCADNEAAAFEEAEHKRRMAGLQEYLDEYQAEFGAFTEEEMAEAERERVEAHRLAEEHWARGQAESA